VLQNRALFGPQAYRRGAFPKGTPRAFAAPKIRIEGPALGVPRLSVPAAAVRQFGTLIAWQWLADGGRVRMW